MSDIFDEVDEDLRADRARKLMQKYGGLLLAAAVLVVVGVGGYQAWQYREARETARVADIFLAAMRIADGPPGTDRQAAAGRVRRGRSTRAMPATARSPACASRR